MAEQCAGKMRSPYTAAVVPAAVRNRCGETFTPSVSRVIPFGSLATIVLLKSGMEFETEAFVPGGVESARMKQKGVLSLSFGSVTSSTRSVGSGSDASDRRSPVLLSCYAALLFVDRACLLD